MKKQLAFCATFLALGIGAVTAAHAQYGPAYPSVYAPGLPPHHVIAIVRSNGMTPLTRPVRRGPNYVVIASDRAGAQVRVVVDAFDGAIVRVRPVVAMRRPYGPAVAADPYAPRPRVAIARPEMRDPPPAVYGADPYGPRARADDGLAPLPPRSVPNARVATAPNGAAPPATAPHAVAPHALAAQPQRTPLPRPRPAIASNDTTGTVPAAADPPAAAKAEPPAATAETKAWPVPASPAESAPKSGELKMIPVAPLD